MIIQIFIDLYAQGPAFHGIANPEFAEALLAAEDLVVLKALSGATKYTETGDIALWVAAKKGSLDCVEFLLRSGCNIDATDDSEEDDSGETALMKEVEEGHLNIVKLLHEAGADVNFTIPSAGHAFCRTPLLKAASTYNEHVVKYLLEKGAHLGNPRACQSSRSGRNMLVRL